MFQLRASAIVTRLHNVTFGESYNLLFMNSDFQENSETNEGTKAFKTVYTQL